MSHLVISVEPSRLEESTADLLPNFQGETEFLRRTAAFLREVLDHDPSSAVQEAWSRHMMEPPEWNGVLPGTELLSLVTEVLEIRTAQVIAELQRREDAALDARRASLLAS